MCPQCKQGYVWDDLTAKCVTCDQLIDDCNDCIQTPQGELNLCTSCNDEMFPTYDQLQCMEHIPNCDIENGIDSYFVKNDEYQCLNCLGDHVWNGTS